MANVLIEAATMTAIGDSIREKLSSTDTYKPSEMPAAIESISGGGQPDARFKQIVEGTLTVLDDDTITSVADYAFYEKNNLTSVNLPNALSIGEKAFYYNRNLTTFNAPKIKSLGRMALYDCESLETMIIPAEVSELSDQCLYGCSSLTTLTLLRTESIVSNPQYTYALEGCDSLTDIYVPVELLSAYKSSPDWAQYADKIKPLFDITGCTQIILPENMPTVVSGGAKSMTVPCSCFITGTDTITGEVYDETNPYNVEMKLKSDEFGQNDTDEERTVTVTFRYYETTATATVTQKVKSTGTITYDSYSRSDVTYTPDEYNDYIDSYIVHNDKFNIQGWDEFYVINESDRAEVYLQEDGGEWDRSLDGSVLRDLQPHTSQNGYIVQRFQLSETIRSSSYDDFIYITKISNINGKNLKLEVGYRAACVKEPFDF